MSDPFKPTDAQKAEVSEALRFWRNVLFLNHYRITPQYDAYDEADPDVRAKCDPNSIYKFATITFMPGFFRDTKSGQESSVIHELLHIVLEPLAMLYRYLLEGKLVTRQQYRDAIEEAVVHLTTVIQKMEEEHAWMRAEIERLKAPAADQTASPHPDPADSEHPRSHPE